MTDPNVVLISLNDEVVHGVPGDRVIRRGDMVKIDVTAEVDGYVADAADTVIVGSSNRRRKALAACARSAFWKAMDVCRAGLPINGIGAVIEAEVMRRGFSVIRSLSGHGVGRSIHEWPSVPNYRDPYQRGKLGAGLVLAVEPIICAGSGVVEEDEDGWTVKTADRSPAAHFEHTIVVTAGEPLILTAA